MRDNPGLSDETPSKQAILQVDDPSDSQPRRLTRRRIVLVEESFQIPFRFGIELLNRQRRFINILLYGIPFEQRFVAQRRVPCKLLRGWRCHRHCWRCVNILPGG